MYGFGLETLGTEFWKKWVHAGRRHHVAPKEASLVWGLSHNKRYKLSLTAIFVLFAAVYGLAFVWGNVFADDPMWKRLPIQYGFLALVGLCFVSVAFAFYDRVEISEHSLTIHTLFRPTLTIQWDEIRSLSISPSVNREDIVLPTSSGSKRSISLFMNGLGTLREFLDRKVPLEKWEEAEYVLPYVGELR